MSNVALLSSFNESAGKVYAFGLRYQTTPGEIREKLAFAPEQVAQLLPALQQRFPETEIALLATCNRTELYCYSVNGCPEIGQWLVENHWLSEQEAARYLFHYSDREAVRHLYRVACGLDSMVLGEPQILGQLKAAYRVSKASGGIGSVLERLFQQSFSVAKHIRHSTSIGENPVSVAYAGVRLTGQFFDDYPRRTAIIVGAGETAQLLARYLKDCQVKRLIIANRTLANAQLLAEEVGGYAISLNQLEDHLHEADMLFGAARSDLFLVSKAQAKKALKARSGAFQVYIDLAIPRNFDPGIDGLGNAFSYGLDDLEQITDDNREMRKQAASEAEVLINLFSDDFFGWLQSKPQQQLIRQIREQADSVRQQLLKEAYRRLAHGDDPAKVLEALSYKLTNKLLHQPSTMIQAIPPDHKDWLAIIADVFETDRGH